MVHREQHEKLMAHEVYSPLFKDPEAAHYIGMSESWLRQSRMRGNPEAPPYIKIGKAVRYLKTDLDDWLDRLRHVEPEVA